MALHHRSTLLLIAIVCLPLLLIVAYNVTIIVVGGSQRIQQLLRLDAVTFLSRSYQKQLLYYLA